MNNFLQMIFNSKNPKELFFQMMQQNPQFQMQIQALQNSGGGASVEQMARQLAQQKGISEQDLMNMVNNLKR